MRGMNEIGCTSHNANNRTEAIRATESPANMKGHFVSLI